MRNPKYLGIVALLTVGCAGAPQATVKGAVAYAHTLPVETVAGERCVVMDSAHDSRIAERWPDRNYGSQDAMFTGNVGGAERQALIGFELAGIPVGAVITSAKLTLALQVGGAAVAMHRITAPWNESSVSWTSFQHAYETEAVAHATADADSLSFDVTELVKSWHEGAPNHGVLLRQEMGQSALSAPQLTVCYAGLGDKVAVASAD